MYTHHSFALSEVPTIARLRVFVTAVLVVLVLAPPAGAQPPDLAKLDAAIERARGDWNVPGLAVAIVKDGKVVLAKGYGVREMSKPDAVDADTLFAIASNTKAFTDASVALENGSLVLRLLPNPDMVADLTHWHVDTFELVWRRRFPWFGNGRARFVLDENARVTDLALDVPNQDFWFYELELKRAR